MNTFQIITAKDSLEFLEKKAIRLIDIRDKATFSAGHIPKAEHVDTFALNKFLENAPKDAGYLIYCYHGHSSQRIAQHLIERGLDSVYNLSGGFSAWQEAAKKDPERFKIISV